MSRRRARREGLLASRAAKVGAAISAIVATLAALVAILEYVDRQVDPEVPVKLAQIETVDVRDTAQPLRDYLAETRPTDGRRYTPAELRREGYTFLLALSAEGPKGSHLRLRWELHEADGRRVPGADYSQVAADFTTSATRQGVEWPVWVPLPPRAGRYSVRFCLEDEDERPLDQAESARFAYPPRGG